MPWMGLTPSVLRKMYLRLWTALSMAGLLRNGSRETICKSGVDGTLKEST